VIIETCATHRKKFLLEPHLLLLIPKNLKPHFMQKKSIIRFAGLFGVLVFVASAQGQIARNTIKIDPSTIIASLDSKAIGKDEDKKILESLKINHPKIFKDYTKNYSTATDIKISKRANYTFIWAIINSVKTRVSYNENGRWQSTLKYYSDKHLAPEIRQTVLSAYPCYKVSGVVEVQVGNKTAHLVTIENNSAWKTIKVVNDEFEVYESFEKN
jgi:hypothetical protein